MIQFLIKRPIAVCMTFLALLFLGIASFKQLPVSLLPGVDIPQITVRLTYPSYTANEFENNITKYFRRFLQQCNGLEDIESQTHNGHAIIKLRFRYGTRIDYAAIEANEKVDMMMQWVPNDFKRPRVIKASVSDVPVFYLNMHLKEYTSDADFLELSRFSKNVIAKRIEQIPEVGLVDITGQEKPQITIIPDEAKMKSLGLSNQDIEDFFNYNNIQIGNISVKDGYYRYNVQFSSRLSDITDIKNIVLPVGNRIIQLHEIANIEVTSQKREGLFYSGNNKAISLAIIKQPDAKMQTLKQKLRDEIDRIKDEYPETAFEITQDQTALLEHSINNMKSTLWVGSLLSFLVIFLFLSNIRLPVLMGITIPISVIISILFFMFFGISINIVSLSGLVLGIGMMIDNSIIVIDNISQHRERGLNLADATIKGTNEVIRPLLSSALTTTAVFVPLVFMSGIAGALFVVQAITVSLGLGISFIVSITLLPVLFYVFHKKSATKNTRISNRVFTRYKFLSNFYERGFQVFFKYRRMALLGFILILPIAALLFMKVNKSTFPEFTQKASMLTIDWSENISLKESRDRCESLISQVDSQLITANNWLGQQDYILNNDYNLLASQLKLYFSCRTEDDLLRVKQTIENQLSRQYPNAEFRFEVPTNIFEKTFADNQLPFIVQIIPKEEDVNYDEVSGMARHITDELGLPMQNQLLKQEYTAIILNQEKLHLYDVPAAEIYNALKTSFNINNIGNLGSYSEVIPVIIGAPVKSLTHIINEVKVRNSNNVELPVKEFISVEKRDGFKTVFAGKKGRFVPLGYNIKARDKNQYENVVRDFFDKNEHSYTYDFSGSIYRFSKYLEEIAVILLVSLVLLYFILSAQFESLVQPLILMLEIPIGIAGAILMLIIFGESLNTMSAIGIIVMLGIIINDSILKIDTINRLYRIEGLSLINAIHEGGRRRLRPIIMTSLTTILALIPFLFGQGLGTELQKPLALAVIGGLSIGTFVSLFFIPLAYWFIYKGKSINN